MPQYEWTCDKCEHITAVVRKMSDIEVPPESCEKCGDTLLHRTISKAPQFILEGSGWHRNEYCKYSSRK